MSDLIDRQAAVDALGKPPRFKINLRKSYEEGRNDQWFDDVSALSRVPSAQPEPLTVNFAREMDRETIEKLKEGLKNAPVLIMAVNDSAQPERKKGKWKAKEEREKQEIFICSECGGWAYSPWIGSRKSPKPNRCKYAFCPNCGARMEGYDED